MSETGLPERDELSDQLRELLQTRIPDDRKGVRLSRRQALVVSRLLSEYARLYPREEIGRLAREMSHHVTLWEGEPLPPPAEGWTWTSPASPGD